MKTILFAVSMIYRLNTNKPENTIIYIIGIKSNHQYSKKREIINEAI